MTTNHRIKWIAKPAVFLACLIPLVLLIIDVVHDNLGANPIETINRYTGDWTLRILLLTLTVTPLRLMTGWQALGRFRRMLGLYAFFYAGMHFLSFAWLDQYFQLDAIIQDVIKRPYITVGFTSFMLLVPLAATSTQAMIRRLGGRRWRLLHRLVYVAAVGGIVHFLWLVKSDLTQPLIYGAVLACLLGYRLWAKHRRSATSISQSFRKAHRPMTDSAT